MSTRIRVEPDLRGLRSIPKRAAQAVERALDETAENIQRTAQMLCPKRSGDLATSITIEKGGSFKGGGFRGSGGQFVSASTALTRLIGSDLDYAAAIENGGTWTVPVTDRSVAFFWAMWYETEDPKWKAMAIKGTYTGFFIITIEPQPYLRPAFDMHAGSFPRLIAQYMEE